MIYEAIYILIQLFRDWTDQILNSHKPNIYKIFQTAVFYCTTLQYHTMWNCTTILALDCALNQHFSTAEALQTANKTHQLISHSSALH